MDIDKRMNLYVGDIIQAAYENCTNRLKSACWKGMEKAANMTYATAKAFYKFRLHCSNRHLSGPPLLIYSMGKVGSQTVHETLKRHKINMPSYHIHHLTHDYIHAREKRYRQYFHQRETQYTDFDMLWRLQYLRERLDKGINGEKWKVLTLVRDPVSVNISTFFHHFDHVEFIEAEQAYKIKSLYYDFETTVKVEDTESLLKLFLEKVDHKSPLSFFDDELKCAFGIDVYAMDFAKSKGYQIYNDELVDLMLIRLENLNESIQGAFKDFLNIEVTELINTNLGNKKAYAPVYKAFKDSVLMPDSYIAEMYDSRFMRHFYTVEEINGFKARWRGAGE